MCGPEGKFTACHPHSVVSRLTGSAGLVISESHVEVALMASKDLKNALRLDHRHSTSAGGPCKKKGYLLRDNDEELI